MMKRVHLGEWKKIPLQDAKPNVPVRFQKVYLWLHSIRECCWQVRLVHMNYCGFLSIISSAWLPTMFYSTVLFFLLRSHHNTDAVNFWKQDHFWPKNEMKIPLDFCWNWKSELKKINNLLEAYKDKLKTDWSATSEVFLQLTVSTRQTFFLLFSISLNARMDSGINIKWEVMGLMRLGDVNQFIISIFLQF